MTSIGTFGVAIASALIFAASAAAQEALPPKHVVLQGEVPPPTGVSGTARAEALILPSGSIARSKAVVSVNHFGDGHYCVKLKSTVSASTALPVLTIDYDHSPDSAAFVQYRPESCSGNEIGVITLALTTSGWGARNEAFVIVVP